MASHPPSDALRRLFRVLIAHPRQFDREIERSPPPPYSAVQSHSFTRSQRPSFPSERQQDDQQRRFRCAAERDASRPYNQLAAQMRQEQERLCGADGDGTLSQLSRVDFYGISLANVKRRWVEQGIWNEKWTGAASGVMWKHEEPLESDFGTENELQQTEESRESREKDRQASRPYFQFTYQISQERQHIQNGVEINYGGATNFAPDINADAYERVKSMWIKWKIWNFNWRTMPGMSWKHEEPVEEEIAVGLRAAQPNPPEYYSNEDGPSRTGLFAAYQQQSLEVASLSRQEQHWDIVMNEMGNGDERIPEPDPGPRGLLSPTGRRQRARATQIQPTANTTLGFVHGSRVSKASRQKKGRRESYVTSLVPSPTSEPRASAYSQFTITNPTPATLLSRSPFLTNFEGARDRTLETVQSPRSLEFPSDIEESEFAADSDMEHDTLA